MLMRSLPSRSGLASPSCALILNNAASQRNTPRFRASTRQQTSMQASAACTDVENDAAVGNSKAAQPISFTAPSAVLKIDTTTYSEQLQSKLNKLKELFSDMKHPDIEVFDSEPMHYRMRAEFNVWGTRQGETPHYIMFETNKGQAEPHAEASDTAADNLPPEAAADATAAERPAAPAAEEDAEAGSSAPADSKKRKRNRGSRTAKKQPVRRVITEFPVGSRLINELMPLVMAEVARVPQLKERLFQVNYHTTLSGQAMVVLLYHKQLDDSWKEAAQALRQVLVEGAPSAQGQVPHVIGRSRKQKVSVEQDFVTEKLTVDGTEYVYKQYEGSFSQPNGGVCQKMLEWARSVTTGSQDHDLLELYCGNGNFTIPMSKNFRRVVATEVSKVGVDAAKWNAEANGVADRLFVGRLASEEFVETWRAKGTRRRLAGLWDWSELDLRTLLVDPPRAGLDPGTVELMSTFERVVYISCNPTTLHANLQAVKDTHDIVRMAAFDQFPFTHHLECGVYLVKKGAATASAVAGETAAAPAQS